MRRVSQYCPIARASELVADRWTVLLVRDLLGGADRFNDLARGLPGLSRGMLVQRLRRLERDGLLVHEGERYLLTAKGRALRPMLEALGTWAVTWTFGEPTREELDPDLLMWWIHRHVPADRFPPSRTTVEFEFTDVRRRYWVLLTDQESTLCPRPPAFATDVAVRTTCSLLYQIWQGRARTRACRDSDLLLIQGPRALRTAVGHWLDTGPLAALALNHGDGELTRSSPP